MKNIESQTAEQHAKSGGGDHPHLACDFFASIRKAGVFGEKTEKLNCNSKDSTISNIETKEGAAP